MQKQQHDLTSAIRNEIADQGLQSEFHTVRTKCMGRCEDGPVMMSVPDSTWFKNLNHEAIPSLIKQIANNCIKKHSHYLYAFGDNIIKSNSKPTN